MPELAQNIIVILITTIAAFIALLYIKEHHKVDNISDYDEKQFEKTNQKSFQILNQAIKKAQSILSVAELQGLKIIASSKVSSGKLDKEYEDKILKSLHTSEDLISKEISSTQKIFDGLETEYKKFLEETKTRTSRNEEQTQLQAVNKMSQLFESFETRLTEFLLKTESETTQSIALELRSTRQLIETYKNQQLSLIDENIIAMMEETLSSVLGKKLSLKDQMDLVYEALEKAKIDKFIV